MLVYKKDMSEIYKILLKHECYMQPIIVDKHSSWIPSEFAKAPIILVCNSIESGQKEQGLLYILDFENIDKFEKILSENIPGMIVPNLDEIVEFEANVSKTHIKFLYEHALVIAEELKINIPPFFVMKERFLGRGQSGYVFPGNTKDGEERSLYISILKQGKPYMLATLAHEMRHCWQNMYMPVNPDYKDGKIVGPNYALQEEELDADAYSIYYLNRLGYNGVNYVFEDEVAREYWKTRIEEIKRRVKNMELQ